MMLMRSLTFIVILGLVLGLKAAYADEFSNRGVLFDLQKELEDNLKNKLKTALDEEEVDVEIQLTANTFVANKIKTQEITPAQDLRELPGLDFPVKQNAKQTQNEDESKPLDLSKWQILGRVTQMNIKITWPFEVNEKLKSILESVIRAHYRGLKAEIAINVETKSNINQEEDTNSELSKLSKKKKDQVTAKTLQWALLSSLKTIEKSVGEDLKSWWKNASFLKSIAWGWVAGGIATAILLAIVSWYFLMQRSIKTGVDLIGDKMNGAASKINSDFDRGGVNRPMTVSVNENKSKENAILTTHSENFNQKLLEKLGQHQELAIEILMKLLIEEKYNVIIAVLEIWNIPEVTEQIKNSTNYPSFKEFVMFNGQNVLTDPNQFRPAIQEMDMLMSMCVLDKRNFSFVIIKQYFETIKEDALLSLFKNLSTEQQAISLHFLKAKDAAQLLVQYNFKLDNIIKDLKSIPPEKIVDLQNRLKTLLSNKNDLLNAGPAKLEEISRYLPYEKEKEFKSHSQIPMPKLYSNDENSILWISNWMRERNVREIAYLMGLLPPALLEKVIEKLPEMIVKRANHLFGQLEENWMKRSDALEIKAQLIREHQQWYQNESEQSSNNKTVEESESLESQEEEVDFNKAA